MEKIITKNTWIGLAGAILLLALGLALGAFLFNQSVISPEIQNLYLTITCAIATFFGSFIGGRGKEKHLLRALAVCAAFYLLLWIFTLSADGVAAFDRYAIQTTTAMWCAGILASLLVPRKKQKQGGKRRRKPVVKKEKRAVT